MDTSLLANVQLAFSTLIQSSATNQGMVLPSSGLGLFTVTNNQENPHKHPTG